MPLQREHGRTQRVRRWRIARILFEPVSGVSNRTVTCRAYVKNNRLSASAHANFMTPDLQRHPLVSHSVPLPCGVELLDKKILDVRSDICQAPADSFVVTNDN